MTYETARAFADTWGLVFLIAIFVAVLVYIFRRGSTERYRRASRIPLDAKESPADSDQRLNEVKADARAERGSDEPGTRS